MLGVRRGLGAALLATLLAAGPEARAQPAQGTWTDPPARDPAAVSAPRPDLAAKPAPPRPEAAAPKEARAAHAERKVRDKAEGSTPTAAKAEHRTRAASRAARSHSARRPAVEHGRAAEAGRARSRAAARAPYGLRLGRAERPRFARRAADPRWSEAEAAGDYDAEDERLDRLRSATAAGYIVLRRRSVEFPDGRALRVYRPYETDGLD